MEKFHWGWRSHTVSVKNLKLHNTAEFGGAPFLDITEVNADYVRAEMAAGKLHLRDVQFHLAEVNLVKNKAGKFNVNFAEDDAAAAGPPDKRSKPWLEFAGIYTLRLTLGRMVYTDMQNPANNAVYDLAVNNEVLKNVQSESDLINWLLAHLMAKDLSAVSQALKLDSSEKRHRAKAPRRSPATNANGAAGTNRPAESARLPTDHKQ